MAFRMKQISSLEKVRTTDAFNFDEINQKTVLAGERFSYQITIRNDTPLFGKVLVESELAEYITLFQVRDAYMDMPVTDTLADPEDYITLQPGFMPDILVPLQKQNNKITLTKHVNTIWVKVDIPKNFLPGTYSIKITILPGIETENIGDLSRAEKVMTIKVLPKSLPKQKLIYTRWFYADCIANQHNVEIFSEEHWDLIENYIAIAVDMGINMILVPIHTPPLDTDVGTRRPCVQLVDIEKRGDKYEFSFEKFERFVNICKKQGIKYYEMAHVFSQWGAEFAANIMVSENGKKDYMFGWHTEAQSADYIFFLKQYISAISAELEREGISENTFFHISDEPQLQNMESYKIASDIFRPLIGNSKTFDALSNYSFYENGLIECPVTSVAHIHEFLKYDVPNQWVYYCCGPQEVYTNSLMAMPSCRTRSIGFLLYKYNIKGFLHWGYNFYNASVSYYPIDPYMTTSGDGAFPSGDPFIVYPGKDGAYTSIRGQVMYEAIQDMDICCTLEEYVGREAVVEMIDSAAGRELRFDDYPSSIAFLEGLRVKMIDRIAQNI